MIPLINFVIIFILTIYFYETTCSSAVVTSFIGAFLGHFISKFVFKL